jgi:hypothetical protein
MGELIDMANHPNELSKPATQSQSPPHRKDWDVETGIRSWYCPECRKRYGLPVAQRVAMCPGCGVYLVRSEVGK